MTIQQRQGPTAGKSLGLGRTHARTHAGTQFNAQFRTQRKNHCTRDRAGGDRAPALRRHKAGERGAVTAEFAVALPAVIAVLGMLLGAVAAGTSQLRLEEASRAAARALARGEPPGEAQDIAVRLAGSEATATTTNDGGGWLSVQVSAPAPGVLSAIVPWTLSAKASARSEESYADEP
ncbi:TadE family type IV pilus minor pilin [Pseudarthrobacter sp. J1738]|uniref:TadE family type IV pilus minor pilin n=1 Tax=unclassified Pseudarthrobacter TaxID=2647000 RepID=UPI003D290035